MFERVLIANRGEIACRIMRTVHRMGLVPIAIYSTADADALHARTALELGGEALSVGPARSSESYLAIERVLEACRRSGAQAVHPGYGFLSENSGFAAALEAEGIVFIGPPAAAIEAMGDKIASKRLAQATGVSTVPGHLEALRDPDVAVQVARDIGYPVMLKASAGGGGKGMRLAWSDEDVRRGLESAMNEGRASFGDDRVFVEKFIEQPRHIEIQVLADCHGNVVYLHERECSIQRRHQKVIEEAPSPFLDAGTRQAMGEHAVMLARQVKYRSAGTVEFIVDKNRNFYFLEMNTRLQVEHPVTEMITGLDLVEWMIRIAAGEKLSFGQQDVRLQGWAIEARIYAEDPERGFLPSTGRLRRYREPPAVDSKLRCDSGCYEGAEISMFYDPMIAKLIVHEEERASAVAALRLALDGYHLRGVQHNVPFLANLAKHPRFASGDITTGFIAEVYPEGLTAEHLKPEDPQLFAAVAMLLYERASLRSGLVAGQGRDYTAFLGTTELMEIAASVDDRGAEAIVSFHDRKLCIAGHWPDGAPLGAIQVGGTERLFQFDRDGLAYVLSHGGAKERVLVVESRLAPLCRLMPAKAAPDLSGFLLSPMPGLLVRVAVSPGDLVEPGADLAVVEAMKMENVLCATRGGRIKAVLAEPGVSLVADQPILTFE